MTGPAIGVVRQSMRHATHHFPQLIARRPPGLGFHPGRDALGHTRHECPTPHPPQPLERDAGARRQTFERRLGGLVEIARVAPGAVKRMPQEDVVADPIDCRESGDPFSS